MVRLLFDSNVYIGLEINLSRTSSPSNSSVLYSYQLIRSNREESYAEFAERIKKMAEPLVQSPEIQSLKYTLTDEKPPGGSVIPFGKTKIAAIRIGWSGNIGTNPFRGSSECAGSYHVEEALPVAYEKNWADGERTPGVCLLTLFRKKPKIDYDTFIDRWHNGHTPLSLKIHPLWHYSRNVVQSRWEDEEPWYDGIVEEHCKTRKELLNPTIFFQNALMMLPNMIRVYFDVRSFLDYNAVEPYYTSEYILKS